MCINFPKKRFRNFRKNTLQILIELFFYFYKESRKTVYGQRTTAANITNYKGIEKSNCLWMKPSEIVNKQIPLFTIQQRYKYYLSCFIFLMRIYPSTLLSESAFLFSCASMHMRFFPVLFFRMCFIPVRFFPGHHKKQYPTNRAGNIRI